MTADFDSHDSIRDRLRYDLHMYIMQSSYQCE